MKHRVHTMTLLTSFATIALAPSFALAVGVNPISVNPSILPGESLFLTTTVSTPAIPPTPDIVILIDSTDSMVGAIDSLRTGLASLITTVKATQPDAQFAIVDYKDEYDPTLFRVGTDLTADSQVAIAAANAITASGGGDEEEAQLNALWQIGSGAITFRPGSSRVIAWFGDAPGHDPSNGHSLADAVTSLTGAGAKVITINVDDGYQSLDGPQLQATAITEATGGIYYADVDPAQVADTILEGLGNLPATVTPIADCADGLTLTFTPASVDVSSGTDAVFTERLTVSSGAAPGTTVACTTAFLINGAEATGVSQVSTVAVGTPLAVSCAPGPNHAGEITDASASGFFTIVAGGSATPITLMVSDTDSSFIRAVEVGSTIELSQTSDVTPTAVVGSGMVDWTITVKGDLVATVTDAEGNTARALCWAPPAS